MSPQPTTSVANNASRPPMEAPVTVLQDSGQKVVLSICVPGLKKRQSIWLSILSIFRKSRNPFRLASNAKFGAYSLSSTSLDFTVEVFDNKAAVKRPGSICQKFFCKINKFPSRINAESAQFELLEGASGDCYFVLTCVKLDNYTVNWKEYLATYGTLDSSQA
ncbi:CBR-LIN-33 protein [Ditylenchus destructor]|uniref:CBR-LIN-33 protein n=1 Tax=Ditylenchus destructor TaxID=166010 RepID=A0AAD4R7V1_9BILA|nr:CBR-LIN-33 protein [Ditylenchus destructor]